MKLDEAQLSRVREWIDQGKKVAEIQTRLNDEFGIRLTYMEARFLLDDLQLRPKDPPASKVPSQAQAGGGSVLAGSGPDRPQPKSPALPGGLAGPSGNPLKTTPLENSGGAGASVTVDSLARPGAVASGKVTFSDGQEADWQIDTYGRLGLVPSVPGYKPTPADIASFRAELEGVLSKMGY